MLRVIEAYCAAYQNTSRNTIHSGESKAHLSVRHRFGFSIRLWLFVFIFQWLIAHFDLGITISLRFEFTEFVWAVGCNIFSSLADA